ncbi:MAG: DUF4163 domain-containing protein [Clostridiales bacterium]|nr:DUF4163 domain-containing protein [Clostridiales bacterium]
MKKKTLRTMTTLMSTVVIGSSLFAGCSSKNESTSTSVEDNSIAVSPTKEATTVPVKEATTVPVKEVTTVPTEEATITPSKEATQEPTKNANGMQETSDSTNSDVSVTFESIDEIIKDEENSDVVLIELSYNRPVITIANNEAASKKINDYFAKLYEENQATMEEYKADAKELYKEREIRSEWRGYEIGMNYSLERADENCISFECSFYCDYTYLHPTYWECGYTFNTSTGELLTLEDISSDLDTF